MNNKNLIPISIVTITITTLIAILLPLPIRNNTAFIISIIVYLLYGAFSILLNNIIKKDKPSKNIKNIPIYYYYLIALVLIYISVIANKLIFIDTAILIIMYLIIGFVFFFIIYGLYLGVNRLNKREEINKEKRNCYNEWLSNLELLLKEDLKDKEKNKINELYELIKYSDSLSIEETSELDKDISKLIDKLNNNIDFDLLDDIKKKVNKRISIIKNNKE